MVPYVWVCPGCGTSCQAPIWRILDSRERVGAVSAGTPSLAWVGCPSCGTRILIDAPLLLIHADQAPPLLLALPFDEIADETPRCAAELLRAAGPAVTSDPQIGPVVYLPRLLLLTVLLRDAIADLQDPDEAYREVLSQTPEFAEWYRVFLEQIQVSDVAWQITQTLRGLLGTRPEDLEEFVESHPGLATSEAATRVRSMIDTQAPGEYRDLLESQLQVIQGMIANQPIADIVDGYKLRFDSFNRQLHAHLGQLLDYISTHPGRVSILEAREALGIAIDMQNAEPEAALSHDLGIMLLTRAGTGGSGEAIRLLERALSLTPQYEPRWSNIVAALAAAYHRTPVGDSFENWQKAKDLLDQLCIPYVRDQDSRQWAAAQTSLGLMLSERPGGSSKEDMRTGIEHIKAGLQERTPDLNAVDWAYSLLNLGLLYQRLGESENLAIAKDYYCDALKHLQPTDDVQLWVTLKGNLADVLLSMDPPNTDRARIAVESALSETTREADALVSARLLRLLARVVRYEKTEVDDEVVQLLREASSLARPNQSPSLHIQIGGELANIYTKLKNWSDAADVYTTMLDASNLLYDMQTTPPGRRHVLELAPRLFRWASFCLARAGRIDQAVEVIENGQARQLSTAVGRDTADLERLAGVDPQLAGEYRVAQDHYRAVLGRANPEASEAALLREASEAERSLTRVIEQIRTFRVSNASLSA